MYTAVIIEPRKHKALSFVLNNVLDNLPTEWNILIFHGTENQEYIKQLPEFSNSRILPPICLDVKNLSISQYNILLKSSAFYQCIPTELFIIFQTDAVILTPELLPTFLEYDYIGAPWGNGMVGNGGFSLRRKSKMIEICNSVPSFIENEDNYFSYQDTVYLSKPSFEMAKTFSVETVFYEKPFAIHAVWKYLNHYDMTYLLYTYPAIQTLIDLQAVES